MTKPRIIILVVTPPKKSKSFYKFLLAAKTLADIVELLQQYHSYNTSK
jgi:hypothetical protein